MKKVFAFLFICLAGSSILFADTRSGFVAQVSNTDQNQELELLPQSSDDIDQVSLRNALELEQASLEYIMAFEAYTEARKSKDPEVRKKIVGLMQNYRNSYARFLEMLRQDNLYHPQKSKNPAGVYNKKHEQVYGTKRVWIQEDAAAIRKQIKEKVKAGASPEEIKQIIRVSLPELPQSYEVDPSEDPDNEDKNKGDKKNKMKNRKIHKNKHHHNHRHGRHPYGGGGKQGPKGGPKR